MITVQQANYTLNINLHVLILFSFLTIFFFAYIAHLEEKTVSDELSKTIDSQVSKILNEVKVVYKNDLPKQLRDELQKLANNIIKKSSMDLPKVKQNNDRLKIIGVIMIIILVVVFISLLVFFHYKKFKINYLKIIIENLIIFGFIGVIEFGFFSLIASKYIPVTPDVLSKTVLDRIKFRLSDYLRT